jgi:hypothetical protein
VPVLKDKKKYVFVTGVLERPPVSEENEQKWFQAKNEQISHDDISTCSQCRSFSVRSVFVMITRCFAVITSHLRG